MFMSNDNRAVTDADGADVRGGQATDEDRRRLLRAAAVFPVVATIPSGAALAQGSAIECINSSKEQTDIPQGDVGAVRLVSNTSDGWVRDQVRGVNAATAKLSPSGTRQTITLISFSGDSGPWYAPTGEQVTLNPSPPGALCSASSEYCKVSAPFNTRVLRIYSAQYQGTDPMGVTLVSPPPPDYPIHITQGGIPSTVMKPPRPGDLGNMGIRGTCLCSVDPSQANCQIP